MEFKYYFYSFLFLYQLSNVSTLQLLSYVSQCGLHGEIQFSDAKANPKLVKVETSLETTLQFPEQSWSWAIHQNPIDYTIIDPEERCSLNNVGPQTYSFDDKFGFLTFPGNETTSYEVEDIKLTGPTGLWGRSLVLTNGNNERICSSIVPSKKGNDVINMAEAKFRKGIGGTMHFRWLKSQDYNTDLSIYSTLYHTQDSNRFFNDAASSVHAWKIYATDIFDQTTDRIEENCNVLQVIYDPQNYGSGNSIGDIDLRVGKLNISENIQKFKIHQLFYDDKLQLLPADLSGPSRKLYVVIVDSRNEFLACAKIRQTEVKVAKTLISSEGIKGELTLMQQTKFEPTFLDFNFHSADNSLRNNIEFVKNLASFKIHELPPSPLYTENLNEFCGTAGKMFDPRSTNENGKPPPFGYGTQDQYAIGDLSGKLTGRNKNENHSYIIQGETNELNGVYWDVFMPLSGKFSVVNRGFSINRHQTDPQSQNITETPFGCSTFSLYEQNQEYQTPMLTAEVLFRYPIVGKILFRQPKDHPWLDTTVLIEYLIHADGSNVNDTENHQWSIHMHQPDKDYYSWQNRCISTGDVINTYKVSFDTKAPDQTCSFNSNELCRLGDLSRLGVLSIAGNFKNSVKHSRKIFTDSNLPLSGFSSILGKSITIFDEHGPKARGNRLGCSVIKSVHRRKVVAKDWFANGGELTLKGKIEMVQQLDYEVTNVEVNVKGLKETSTYHVHIAPVEGDLEFPCEATTLHGHWNPRNVSAKNSPLPGVGSSDLYEIGDLSGKFGTLDNLSEYETSHNDTNLPLFGYESIIGRSIVIHKKKKMARWACSTLERGYSPNEAREIKAIASFHHPHGHAFGYMKFTQLIGNDGAQSETVIETKLRYPGNNNRNITRNHHWQIFVNPIGIDATIASILTRCVAGGYVWNPSYTQLADPLNDELYRQECGPKNPLRCYVGDVSARLGTIDIGLSRRVMSDSNFPLEGEVSALGRSIVIFGQNHSSDRMACANIEPDHDIVKYVNIERPPRFVLSQFIEDVRKVMGLPEWFLFIDSRTTQILHNGACIAFKLHFKGPKAHQLEQDFSRLIGSGKLEEPSLYIPGFVDSKRKKTIAYRTCSVRDPNDRKKGSKKILSYKTDKSLAISNRLSLIIMLFSFILNYKM